MYVIETKEEAVDESGGKMREMLLCDDCYFFFLTGSLFIYSSFYVCVCERNKIIKTTLKTSASKSTY